MLKACTFLLPLILSLPTFAGGSITYLNITEGSVVFATDEAKTAASPACVNGGNEDKWAVSLQSDEGRAIYSLLMTSMAAKSQIGVTSAGDCAAYNGYERPSTVWFDAAESASDSSGGGMYKLRPDLDYFDRQTNGSNIVTTQNIDATSGLTPVLSLSGKHVLQRISLGRLTRDDVLGIKLTIDGEVIWDGSFVAPHSNLHLFAYSGLVENVLVEESLLLEIKTTNDNAIDVSYSARPIK